jgi:biopolymer transport protein ExbD
MTPMVDITLVILIFFMASATIAGPEWFLRAELPPTAPASPALSLPSPVVRAEVFVRDGGVLVRGLGAEQGVDGVLALIADLDDATADGLVVEIEAADDVAYESVARLHAALVQRGADVRLR